MSTTATDTVPTDEQPTLVQPARPAAGSFAMQILRDTAYLLLGLVAGTITFTVIVAGWSTGLSSLITFIGIPLIVLTVYLTRGMAIVERGRHRVLLGEDIPGRYTVRLPLHRDDWRAWRPIWERHLEIAKDAQTWKDTAYGLLLLIVGTIGFTVAVVAWAVPLYLMSLPIWWQFPGTPQDLLLFRVDSWPHAAMAFGLGLITIPIGLVLIRATSEATAWFTRRLLGRDEVAVLEQRVEHLEETRAGAVDAARIELERIERDLHDGAQARLVAVAMELGRAEQKLRAGEYDAAGELLEQARGDTQNALTEMRDLARGIRPALLTERGLTEAVTSLAARATVPTTVACVNVRRVPPAVETAAYFVVAEALANVGKHAEASGAGVRVERRGDRLEVEVRDDGRGGADPEGGGLVGLRKRVQALDGTLFLSSPPGGPTVLRAELPCGS